MRRFTAFSALLILLISSQSFGQEKPPSTRAFEFRIASDIAIQNYRLASDGFTTSDGGSSGSGLSADFFWKGTAQAFHVMYHSLEHEVNAPAGLSPASVNTKRQRILINYEMESSLQVIYQFGLDYRSRQSTETTPNIFMPVQSRIGLRFGAMYGHSFTETFGYEFGGGLMVPVVISESTANTGNYRFSVNPDLNFDLIYKVNPFIDFSLGVHWLMELSSFAGTGSRGTIDATETFNNFFFPFELRFQF